MLAQGVRGVDEHLLLQTGVSLDDELGLVRRLVLLHILYGQYKTAAKNIFVRSNAASVHHLKCLLVQ